MATPPMYIWYQKRKLVGLVEKLAIYNDKGAAWAGHNEERIIVERQKLLDQIQTQIAVLGENRISSALLDALRNGSLESDITGRYIDVAKQTK